MTWTHSSGSFHFRLPLILEILSPWETKHISSPNRSRFRQWLLYLITETRIPFLIKLYITLLTVSFSNALPVLNADIFSTPPLSLLPNSFNVFWILGSLRYSIVLTALTIASNKPSSKSLKTRHVSSKNNERIIYQLSELKRRLKMKLAEDGMTIIYRRNRFKDESYNEKLFQLL